MKKKVWQKVSVLGIILTATSAFTAAVRPSEVIGEDITGSLTKAGTMDGIADVYTCMVTQAVDTPCNVTAGSLTTASAGANSFAFFGFQTTNNTTTL